MASKAWDVYIEDRAGKTLVDTVWFDDDCDADYVKRALVEHDGYNPAITVRGPF